MSKCQNMIHMMHDKHKKICLDELQVNLEQLSMPSSSYHIST